MILQAPCAAALDTQLRKALQDVQAVFARELQSDLDCVNQLVGYTDNYRGKMLRPTLLLLSATAAAPDEKLAGDHIRLATVMEMVHMATLVHDDILDDADLRRNSATINHLEGNEAAVMLGDYLISHAFGLCSRLGDASISMRVSQVTHRICEGELLQLHHRRNWHLTEAVYFDMIERKTASLIALCCELGAQRGGADAPVVEAMATYGRLVGSAFQIIDDVLDLTGQATVVGKSVRCDLVKGKLTLPLIRTLALADPGQRSKLVMLLERLGKPDFRDAREVIEQLCEVAVTSGAVEQARHEAQEMIDRAKQAIAPVLPVCDACETLGHLADAVITRQF